ncbi:MAG TPA: IPTL-CTERM sorting domain-containing protein [Bacteroidales bacterium]|nr:IPTL-CTERM sorting domain-containing protein [Bacteroidales bacterium]HPS63468.1 IPTL-CTERM sorting domain-containing protein [Bacteroidales bacterium]
MKNLYRIIQVFVLVLIWATSGAQNAAPHADLSDVPGTSVSSPIPMPHLPLTALYDNGPLYNSVGTGAGGANESYLDFSSNSYGSNASVDLGYVVTDDFTIASGTWNISSIDFYAYQTNSGTTSTFTAVYVAIYSGSPDVGTLVWGDYSTNRLGSAVFSNVYRTQTLGNGSATRPIMKVTANTPGLTLPAGTYWVEYGFSGSLSSGPWVPPTVPATQITGNAMQWIGSGYAMVENPVGYARDLPFTVNGEVVAPTIPTLSEWGLIIFGIALLGFGTFFLLRRRS